MKPCRMLWPRVAICLLMLSCLDAHAVTPTDSVTQLRSLFSELSLAIDRYATGNVGLVALGRRTAVALFGVLLVWGMIRSWVLGKGFAQLLPEFFQPLVVLAMTLWAVDHLGPVVRQSVEGLAGVFSETLGLSTGPPSEVDVLQRMAGAGFDLITAAPTSGGATWLEAAKAIADQTAGFLFRLVAAFLLLLAGGLAAGVMVLAKIQTALAILFAPVMIPWAMWQPSAFLFNAWLGFLIGGAMQGVMAAAMAALSVTMVDKIVLLASAVQTDDNVSYVTYSVILLMACFIAYLFTRVPSLAGALVGGASLGLDRWSAVAVQAGRLVSNAIPRTMARQEFGRGVEKGWMTGRGTAAPGRAGAASGVSGIRAVGASTAEPPANGGSTSRAAKPRAGVVSARAARATGQALSTLMGSAARATGSAQGVAAAGFPKSFPESPPKPPHQAFRPKPGARPVNRPLRSG